jgi:hypothetical protein
MLFTAAWVFAHSDVRGQTNEGPSSASNVRYPTMLDMTYKTARGCDRFHLSERTL